VSGEWVRGVKDERRNVENQGSGETTREAVKVATEEKKSGSRSLPMCLQPASRQAHMLRATNGLTYRQTTGTQRQDISHTVKMNIQTEDPQIFVPAQDRILLPMCSPPAAALAGGARVPHAYC
jgi:hypothetical protein